MTPNKQPVSRSCLAAIAHMFDEPHIGDVRSTAAALSDCGVGAKCPTCAWRADPRPVIFQPPQLSRSDTPDSKALAPQSYRTILPSHTASKRDAPPGDHTSISLGAALTRRPGRDMAI